MPNKTPAAAASKAVASEPAEVSPASLAPDKKNAIPSAPASTKAVREACGQNTGTQLPQFTVYTQIYRETERQPAERRRSQFREFGLAAPGVENVNQAAGRAGRPPPVPWSGPVFLYSGYSAKAQACARALATWLGAEMDFQGPPPAAKPLPIRLRGDPNVIEFWLPAPPQTSRNEKRDDRILKGSGKAG